MATSEPMGPQGGKYFYLGMGAQKSGTSWLWLYLKRHANFNLGRYKEYHVWDAVHIEPCKEFRITRPEQVLTRRGRFPVPSKGATLRYLMQRDRSGRIYAGYFGRLIQGGVDSTGDFTESHAGLKAEQLHWLRDRMEGVGFQVKPIFLMRDPFERSWSLARMQKRNGEVFGSDEQVLGERYALPKWAFRSDYKSTIEQLEQVFSRDDIYYGIYEEMFTPERIADVSNFCRVAPEAAFGRVPVNASPKSEAISEGLRLEVTRHYAEVYEFCYERFPQTRQLWHQLR